MTEGEKIIAAGLHPGVTTPAICGEEPHGDPGGEAVAWGITHRATSAADCCDKCTAHAKLNPKKPCNSWSFCYLPVCWGLDNAHNHTFGECWLKYQPNLAAVIWGQRGQYTAEYREKHKRVGVQWHYPARPRTCRGPAASSAPAGSVASCGRPASRACAVPRATSSRTGARGRRRASTSCGWLRRERTRGAQSPRIRRTPRRRRARTRSRRREYRRGRRGAVSDATQAHRANATQRKILASETLRPSISKNSNPRARFYEWPHIEATLRATAGLVRPPCRYVVEGGYRATNLVYSHQKAPPDMGGPHTAILCPNAVRVAARAARARGVARAARRLKRRWQCGKARFSSAPFWRLASPCISRDVGCERSDSVGAVASPGRPARRRASAQRHSHRRGLLSVAQRRSRAAQR